MKKTLLFSLLVTVCAATAPAAPQDLEETLSQKAAQARPTAWHIDDKAILNVSLRYTSGNPAGRRSEPDYAGCRGLLLNRRGLVLLGESCAKALNAPVSRVSFSATLPLTYAGRHVYYTDGPLPPARFIRGGHYALYQLREYVPLYSSTQYKRGMVNPRTLAKKTSDIFKDMEIPQIFGADENKSFITQDFKKIFSGHTPDEELASWLKKHMTARDFAALYAPLR